MDIIWANGCIKIRAAVEAKLVKKREIGRTCAKSMAFCAPFSAFFKPSPITRCKRNNRGGRNPNTLCLFLGHAAIGSDPLSSSTKLLNDELSLDARRVKKVEEVRRILPRINDPLESMMMIGCLQCLSIDYHFHEEIQEILHRQYNNLGRSACKNLYDVALSFRLLRQHGYYVSPDIFADFRDEKGFRPELSKDASGMLGLYEASCLGIGGEDVLDEARNFTRKHLQASMASSVDPGLVGLISQTLEHPFHLNLPRFNTKAHLKNQQGANVHTQLLHELAMLDFHEVQSLHQSELREVSKWWRELGLAQELTFARDQLPKWYMWPLAILSNPQFSKYRIELTKPISFVYIIDDIFDVQGTLDELILFTEAIERWEVSAIHQLPRYMQICFMALYNVTNEISYTVFKEHGWNPLHSLRKTCIPCGSKMVCLGRDAKGRDLKNGIISSGVNVCLVHAFFLLGHGISRESVESVDSIPGLISSPATILRLWDDLGSAKDESQDGNDGSYVECYMKENGIVSPSIARDRVMRRISQEWKELDQECLHSNLLSIFQRSLSQQCTHGADHVQL